jgi:hypothetical protein
MAAAVAARLGRGSSEVRRTTGRSHAKHLDERDPGKDRVLADATHERGHSALYRVDPVDA